MKSPFNIHLYLIINSAAQEQSVWHLAEQDFHACLQQSYSYIPKLNK